MDKITTEVPGDILKIACAKCSINTNHKTLSDIKNLWGTYWDIQGINHYQIIKCLGCETISFRKTSENSEDIEMRYNPEINKWEHYYLMDEEIYPNRIVGKVLIDEPYHLPEKIRIVYKETHTALASKLKLLAGIGIRSLIEAVCKEEGVTNGNLKEKIDTLKNKNILTNANAQILHELRFLGNKSAHDIETASDVELSVAFDIAENTLQNLYIIPKKAESLNKKIPQNKTV